MLYIWNRNLSKTGAKIIFQRLKYIEAITPYINDIFEGLSRNKESITLRYSSHADYAPFMQQPEMIEKQMFSLLEENIGKDKLNLSTSEGPHRDDIDILINGQSARLYGSQGQQRSGVIALKLAEASLLKELTGVQPIALLDDVMSELDEKRQDYILNNINSAQVFITCCDKEQILRLKEGETLHMVDGRIK
jgi:DNA replication and repair protein RecF